MIVSRCDIEDSRLKNGPVVLLSLGFGTMGRTERNITAQDTVLFGSGTKAIIATRIFQHIEAGNLSLSSLVNKQVDPLLHEMYNTSLVEIFGEPASRVTVGQLLRMASGMGVWDTPTFDNMTWSQSRSNHERLFPPLEFLQATRCEHIGMPADFCASPRMDCEPGVCRQYSSVNFQLLGLVLLRQEVVTCAKLSTYAYPSRDEVSDPGSRCSWQNLSIRSVFEHSPPGRYPSVQFYNAEPLSKWLTVRGWDSTGMGGKTHSFASVRQIHCNAHGGHRFS